MEAEVPGEWKPIYRSDLQEQSAGDYKMFNWYCSTHPDSHFTTDLIATRAVAGGRHTLRNNKLTFYPLGGEKRESTVAGPGALRRVLLDIFDIELPDSGEVEGGFTKLFDAPEPGAVA